MLLKALDTLGNRQRPVFSFGATQDMHKITNLSELDSIGHRICTKTRLLHNLYMCAFRCTLSRVRNYLFLKNYSQNVRVENNTLYISSCPSYGSSKRVVVYSVF